MRAFPLLVAVLLCLVLALPPSPAAPTVVSPTSAIVIHKQPGPGTTPVIQLLPLNWACVRFDGAMGYAAAVGDALASGDTITCGHWGNLPKPCATVEASVTSSTTASGADVGAVATCGGVLAAVSVSGPGGADSATSLGPDDYPAACAASWTALHDDDAWTVTCRAD